MYLVTMKKHNTDTPLDLCKELWTAKARRYDYKIAWGEANPIHIYEVELKEVTDGLER